jgi:hypothetical protein
VKLLGRRPPFTLELLGLVVLLTASPGPPSLEVSPRGRVFIATRPGTVLVGRRGPGVTRAEVMDAELAAATLRSTTQSPDAAFEFEHHGTRCLGRAVPIAVDEPKWLVDVVVPEGDYTDQIAPSARPDDAERAVRCAWAMQEAPAISAAAIA